MVSYDAGPLLIVYEDVLLSVEKDTLIGGLLYKKVFPHVGSATYGYFLKRFLIREDTTVGKVWYREIDSTKCGTYDTVDRLIIDYSLQLNDTFNFGGVQGYCEAPYNKVDSIWYENGRKIIRFLGAQSTVYSRIHFIEGVGTTLSILYGHNCNKLYTYGLLCAWKDGAKTYSNTHFSGNCDPLHSLDISSVSKRETTIIYPNPAADKLFISTNKQDATYEIIDLFGSKVAEGRFYKSDQQSLINISHLSSGIYFLMIANAIHREKIRFTKI